MDWLPWVESYHLLCACDLRSFASFSILYSLSLTFLKMSFHTLPSLFLLGLLEPLMVLVENRLVIAVDFTRKSTYMGCMYIVMKVQFSRSVVSDSLRPHGMQHSRLSCPSPANSSSLLKLMSTGLVRPSNHSCSVVPFFSCIQSCPASRSFPMSQFFTSCGQSIGASASALVPPMNIQD